MKSIVCILAFAALASGMPQNQPAAKNANPAQGNQGGQGTGKSAAPAAPALPPQFYGPGLNNPHAFPQNPILLQRAKQVVQANPNVRVRVPIRGNPVFTDQYGQEIEVVDGFGRDPLELPDPEEALQFQFEQRERQIEQRERQFELEQERREFQAEQQLLQQLLGGRNNANQANPNPAPIGGQQRFIIRH